MPIQIPTTLEIRDRIVSDIEAALNQTVPLLPKAFIRVLAAVLAGLFTLSYKFGLWLFNQIFPQTSDLAGLKQQGERIGVFFKAATQSIIEVEETGTDGAIIPAGQQYIASNQIVFINQSDATIVGGIAALNLLATTGGSAGNLAVGESLAIVSPVINVDGSPTVTDLISQGFDEETTEEYRARVIERQQRKPQGGSVNDYLFWAKEIAGVTRAFVGPLEPGQVAVYPLTGDEAVTRIPDTAKLLEVFDNINKPENKPFVATVFVLAMTELQYNVEIFSLNPNTQEVRDAITDNIASFLLARQPKQFQLEENPKDVISDELLTSIAVQSGATSLTLIAKIGITPTPFKQLFINELAVLSSISFL